MKIARLALALNDRKTRGVSRTQALRNIARLWAADRFPRRGREPVVVAGGLRLHGPSVELLRLLHREVFLSEEYAVALESSEPVIFDCGANIGMATVFFKIQYPKATIVAFEPDPVAFGYLRRNTEALRDSVQLFNFALGGSDAEDATFYSNPENVVLSSMNSSRIATSQAIQVPVRCLSSYVGRNVDLIKIDVEGSEVDLLDDLLRSGAIDRVRHLLIEYHHNLDLALNEKFRSHLTALENRGFRHRFGNGVGGLSPEGGNFQDVMVHVYRT